MNKGIKQRSSPIGWKLRCREPQIERKNIYSKDFNQSGGFYGRNHLQTTFRQNRLEASLPRLGIAFTVHNILGPGLLESAYEGALCVELTRADIPFERQKVYPLYYRGELIGGYIADIVVDNAVICELKSVAALHTVMAAQIINYWSLPRACRGDCQRYRSATCLTSMA
jgi:GxxExxY protein